MQKKYQKLPRANDGGVNKNSGKEKDDVSVSRDTVQSLPANRLPNHLRNGKEWDWNGTLVQV